MDFIMYKNRNGEIINAVRLNTKEDMYEAYMMYLSHDTDYSIASGDLTKKGNLVAAGDYLVIKDGRAFTEVDGMFRRTYYPETFSEEQARKWKACPTLILTTCDTAEDALAELERRGL